MVSKSGATSADQTFGQYCNVHEKRRKKKEKKPPRGSLRKYFKLLFLLSAVCYTQADLDNHDCSTACWFQGYDSGYSFGKDDCFCGDKHAKSVLFGKKYPPSKKAVPGSTD